MKNNVTHHREITAVRNVKLVVAGLTTGSRGKVPGKTCENEKY